MKSFAASVLVSSGAWVMAKLVRERVLRAPALVILCYHRITDAPFAASARCVSRAQLAEQLAFFAAHYDVAPLSAVPGILRDGLRRDTLVITFDDGYLDGYTEAAPLLGAFGVKATFFVSAGPSLDGQPYWMDVLGKALAGESASPRPSGGTPPSSIAPLAEAYRAARDDAGRAEAAASATAALKAMRADERARVLAAIDARSGGPEAPAVMGGGELRAVAGQGHEIGAHGVSHPVLAREDPERCREEIGESISRLRELGFRVASFAYPFGGAAEVGDIAPALVAECGIAVAVTTEERAVRRGDDPFRLPRKVVSGQPIARLAVKLERLAWQALGASPPLRAEARGAG